jgi:hypothetical protein
MNAQISSLGDSWWICGTSVGPVGEEEQAQPEPGEVGPRGEQPLVPVLPEPLLQDEQGVGGESDQTALPARPRC